MSNQLVATKNASGFCEGFVLKSPDYPNMLPEQGPGWIEIQTNFRGHDDARETRMLEIADDEQSSGSGPDRSELRSSCSN
jgi:hypothetical protein